MGPHSIFKNLAFVLTYVFLSLNSLFDLAYAGQSESSSFRPWQRPNILLPNSVSLKDVQEMAWVQESHRLRTNLLVREILRDDNTIIQMLKQEGLNNPTASEIGFFKEATLFRGMHHDFKKGELGNAAGLTRMKGIDLDKLAINHRSDPRLLQSVNQAREIIEDVNKSGQFIEYDLDELIFASDRFGRAIKGRSLERRKILAKASGAIEHVADLMDRALAESKNNREYGRGMEKASDYFSKLVAGYNTLEGAGDSQSKYLDHLKLSEKLANTFEKSIDPKTYSSLTKGLEIDNYLAFRRQNTSLDFGEIAKIKKVFPPIPENLRSIWPKEGFLTQANAEHFTRKAHAFFGFVANTKPIPNEMPTPHAGSISKISKGLGAISKTMTAIARPIGVIQAGYGFYLLTLPDKKPALEFFSDTLGISATDANDGFDLQQPIQAAQFLSEPLTVQSKLIATLEPYQKWVRERFYDLPIDYQQAFLCHDTSLGQLMQIPCMDKIICESKNLAAIQFDPTSALRASKISTTYEDDPWGRGMILRSLDYAPKSSNPKNESTPIFDKNKPKLIRLLDSQQLAMRSWVLRNKRKFEMACRTITTGELSFEPPSNQVSRNFSLQSFLQSLRTDHKNQYPEAYRYMSATQTEVNQLAEGAQ